MNALLGLQVQSYSRGSELRERIARRIGEVNTYGRSCCAFTPTHTMNVSINVLDNSSVTGTCKVTPRFIAKVVRPANRVQHINRLTSAMAWPAPVSPDWNTLGHHLSVTFNLLRGGQLVDYSSNFERVDICPRFYRRSGVEIGGSLYGTPCWPLHTAQHYSVN